MQALYLLALNPVAETRADPNSYGFRSARSAADAIEACFIALCQNNRAEWVLEGDIRSCFDRISHEWLLTHIPMDTTILKKWLKAGYIESRCLHPTEEGTPQGGIISPVITNMTLDGLEQLLSSHFPKEGRKGRKTKVNLIRYADEFCITGSSKELLEQEVKPLVEQFLRERGLEVGHPYLVDAHKTPLRKRSNGCGRFEEGGEATCSAFFGRPRRFGATKGGGGMRNVRTSCTLQG